MSWLASRLGYGRMGISLSCKYLPNEPTKGVFFPELNHSPIIILTASQFHLWKPVGDMSPSMPRFANERNEVWRNSTFFLPGTKSDQDGRRLSTEGEVCALAEPFTRPRAHAASAQARDWLRGSVDLGPSHRLRIESGAFRLSSMFKFKFFIHTYLHLQ